MTHPRETASIGEAERGAHERALGTLRARFEARFGTGAGDGSPTGPFAFASAPGRVELAGNHTDHQGGRTIAAAVDARAFALARRNGTDEIRVSMEGFGEARMRAYDLGARESERGTPASLVRGMAAAFARSGGELCGFDMVTRSDIPVGSGVSSSAAFEVLVGAAIRALNGCDSASEAFDPTALALDGVAAEQAYFGKPCGAQDQLASAYGGIVALDFSASTPHVERIAFDAGECPYAIFLVDSRCDHSEFTDEYAAVPADMHDVARFFGCTRLEDVPRRTFFDRLSHVRAALGDRKALRALHYFDETLRVSQQVRALQTRDFEAFLAQVRLSGASSAQFLQNVSPRLDATGSRQSPMVVLALCAHLLGAEGAWRIHGGGFGGSVLTFVPADKAHGFADAMDGLLGYRASLPVSLSPFGVHAERLA